MEGVKRNPEYQIDDLRSEFGEDSEVELTKKKRKDLTERTHSSLDAKPGRSQAKHWFQEEHGRMHRKMSRLMTLDAYSRHKEMINLYHLTHPGATNLLKRDTSKDRTDYDVLRDNHKFLWSESDELKVASSWESRMAKRYYDKLFKEYCIVDLTFYRENKVAMRWRIENEVKTGKGQFICGNKKCSESDQLTSWEVNFSYKEDGMRKNALVKVRLCPSCSEKLNYGSQKKRVVKKPKKSRKESKYEKEDQKEDIAVKEEKKEQEPENKGTPAPSTSDVWAQPVVVEQERTVDEDIDDYLDQLFD